MTISLQHLTGTSLTLFISVFLSLEITFCSCFFFFFFQFCVVMQIASLRKREAFSIMFYSAACQVVTTMGLAHLPLGMLWACCFSSSCLSVWLAVCPVSSHSTDWGGDLTPLISIYWNCVKLLNVLFPLVHQNKTNKQTKNLYKTSKLRISYIAYIEVRVFDYCHKYLTSLLLTCCFYSFPHLLYTVLK